MTTIFAFVGLLSVAVFLAGCIACAVMLPKLEKLNAILPSVLINTTLACLFFGLLMPYLTLFLLALSPITVAIGCTVASEHWEAPEDLRPVRLYPTHPLSLLLIGGIVILILYRLYAWREANDAKIAALINTAEVAQIASQSLAAKQYLNNYARKYKRTDIATSHLLHVCGSVLRLAGQTSSIESSPTIKACSQSLSYTNDLGLP